MALANWPTWRQYDKPDLCLGHTARTLVAACRGWRWLDTEARQTIHLGLARLVADGVPLVRDRFAAYHSAADILASDDPDSILHNIPIIGTIGLALAARTIAHPDTAFLDETLTILLSAMLDNRQSGFSEALAYNGYVMDFALDWLAGLGAEAQGGILDHPAYPEFFEESYRLAAPGEMTQVAELSDVEPLEMPFHISHHAKRAHLKPAPAVRWYLASCPLDRLRADALAALHGLPLASSGADMPPPAGALNAYYATVLRSGWAPDDLAVAVAGSTSTMGHIHCDNGSVVIGSGGAWLISDPGYQQYMPTTERKYTIGERAHNCPVINHTAQNTKAPRDIVRTSQAADLHRVSLALTDCYPAALHLKQARRTVWLAGNYLVVIADEISGAAIEEISYYWHGDRAAAWGMENGWASVTVGDTQLRFTTPQADLDWCDIDRHPGSRGALTLSVTVAAAPVIWWIFVIGDPIAPLQLHEKDSCLEAGGRQFCL